MTAQHMHTSATCPQCEAKIEFDFYPASPPTRSDPGTGPEIDISHCQTCNHEFTDDEIDNLIETTEEKYAEEYYNDLISRREDDRDF